MGPPPRQGVRPPDEQSFYDENPEPMEASRARPLPSAFVGRVTVVPGSTVDSLQRFLGVLLPVADPAAFGTVALSCWLCHFFHRWKPSSDLLPGWLEGPGAGSWTT